ncbi:uncharacterized protein J3D65DRAFT_286401 [Phyllosticta citribraziliensis]|uniref:Uncharacterized protein n=1 Tax=Phyllosticta citribraziliensis TaxID=989973 RepID=A0ABR1LWP7_9PEZI
MYHLFRFSKCNDRYFNDTETTDEYHQNGGHQNDQNGAREWSKTQTGRGDCNLQSAGHSQGEKPHTQRRRAETRGRRVAEQARCDATITAYLGVAIHALSTHIQCAKCNTSMAIPPRSIAPLLLQTTTPTFHPHRSARVEQHSRRLASPHLASSNHIRSFDIGSACRPQQAGSSQPASPVRPLLTEPLRALASLKCRHRRRRLLRCNSAHLPGQKIAIKGSLLTNAVPSGVAGEWMVALYRRSLSVLQYVAARAAE